MDATMPKGVGAAGLPGIPEIQTEALPGTLYTRVALLHNCPTVQLQYVVCVCALYLSTVEEKKEESKSDNTDSSTEVSADVLSTKVDLQLTMHEHVFCLDL